MTARDPQPCSTCGCPWAEDDFYEGCSECKRCKRARSRRHRLVAARKIAAFERFVDVLGALSAQAGLDDPRDPSGV